TVPYADALTEQVQLHTILEARYNNEALTAAITADHLRPSLPPPSPHAPESLLQLVTSCWSHAPESRPAAETVSSTLSSLASLHSSGEGGGVEGWGDSSTASTDPFISPPEEKPVERAEEVICRLASDLGLSGEVGLRVGVEASAGRRGADRMEDSHLLVSEGGE
ncbi:MAG: hypothetical protein SGPRY_008144, partial [Prymnesium sp.]